MKPVAKKRLHRAYPIKTLSFSPTDDIDLVEIESSSRSGYPGISVIGHSSEDCRDAKERAAVALENLGLKPPHQKIVLSMTPGHVKKLGSQMDLAMALSLFQQLYQKAPMTLGAFEQCVFLGELSLEGWLKPVCGMIPMCLKALELSEIKGLVVPQCNLDEIALVQKLYRKKQSFKIYGFACLQEILRQLYPGITQDTLSLTPEPSKHLPPESTILTKSTTGNALQSFDTQEGGTTAHWQEKNFDDMVLSDELQQLAVCVVAGRHSLLLRGSPGTGKSMFAERLACLWPQLDPDTHLEVLSIYSSRYVQLDPQLLNGRVPVRCPHHQTSASAILGSQYGPGEISLAHGGLLFLDELAEFRRDILEGLREPLETGRVHIARSQIRKSWPARFLLIAATNNCPCGWLGSMHQLCRCTTQKVLAYRNKLSGPLLDRIEIQFTMPELPQEKAPDQLLAHLTTESLKGQTAQLMRRTQQTCEFAATRQQAKDQQQTHDSVASQIQQLLAETKMPTEQVIKLIEATLQTQPTHRRLKKTLCVARTLADMNLRFQIEEEDIWQAAHWQKDIAFH